MASVNDRLVMSVLVSKTFNVAGMTTYSSVSEADIARRTGLTRQAVDTSLDRLYESGWISAADRSWEQNLHNNGYWYALDNPLNSSTFQKAIIAALKVPQSNTSLLRVLREHGYSKAYLTLFLQKELSKLTSDIYQTSNGRKSLAVAHKVEYDGRLYYHV